MELVALVLAGRLAAARSHVKCISANGPALAGPDGEPAPIPVHMDHARKVQKLYDSLARRAARAAGQYPRRHEYAGLTAGERITRACDRLDISPVYYKIALGHMKDQVRRPSNEVREGSAGSDVGLSRPRVAHGRTGARRLWRPRAGAPRRDAMRQAILRVLEALQDCGQVQRIEYARNSLTYAWGEVRHEQACACD